MRSFNVQFLSFEHGQRGPDLLPRGEISFKRWMKSSGAPLFQTEILEPAGGTGGVSTSAVLQVDVVRGMHFLLGPEGLFLVRPSRGCCQCQECASNGVTLRPISSKKKNLNLC